MAASNNGTNTNSDGLSDVQFDYSPAVPGTDLISDSVMAELLRRWKGFVGGGVTGAIVYGSTPPQDKSKLWDKGDGDLYRYDPATATWITGNSADDDIYPGISATSGNGITDDSGIFFEQALPRFVSQVVSITAATEQTIPVAISPAFSNTDYVVVVEPGYINEGFWYVSTHDADLCTIKWTDTAWPGGTTNIRVTIIEKLTA
jgi:hypothetical protein